MPTPLCGALLEGLAKAAHDPDVVAAQWLRIGAPIGIEHDIPACHIFPAVDPHSHRNWEETWPLTEWYTLQGFENYASTENEHRNRIKDTLADERKLGFCKPFRSMQAILRFMVVASLVFALIAVVPKKIGDALRVIHDFRRCGTNKKVRVPERIVLPRLRDIASDCMSLISYWRSPGRLLASEHC